GTFLRLSSLQRPKALNFLHLHGFQTAGQEPANSLGPGVSDRFLRPSRCGESCPSTSGDTAQTNPRPSLDPRLLQRNSVSWGMKCSSEGSVDTGRETAHLPAGELGLLPLRNYPASLTGRYRSPVRFGSSASIPSIAVPPWGWPLCGSRQPYSDPE